MTDTASLVARVKTDGAEAAARQLDDFAAAAGAADSAASSLGDTAKKTGNEISGSTEPLSNYASIAESLGNKIAIMEEAALSGAKSASVLSSQLSLSANATQDEINSIGQLSGVLYDLNASMDAATKKESESQSQKSKTALVIDQLSSRLRLMIVAQKEGATAAAILAAQMRAGSNASSEELDKIAKLTESIKEFGDASGEADEESGDASNGLAKLGGRAGQVGMQVQDMAVQLAGGTNAFVVLGQQGSQLASAFGPGGAVLGAVIAVASALGGVLYKSLTESEGSIDDVEKGSRELSSSFQSSKDGTIEFSDALVTLSQNGDMAYGSMIKLLSLQAKQQLETTTNAIKTQSAEFIGNGVAGQAAAAQLDEMIKKNQDVASILSNVNVITDASTGQYASLAGQVNDIAQKYGVATEQVSNLLVAQREFNAQPTAANAQKVADATTALAEAATNGKKELLDQAVATQTLSNNLSTSEKQLDATTAAQNRHGVAVNSTTKAYQDQTAQIIRNQQIATLSDKERAVAQAAVDKEAFSKRQNVTAEDIAAYNKARDEEAAQDVKRINDAEQKKADAVSKAAQKKEDAQAKRDTTAAAAQKKAADTFIAGVQRQSGDEIAQINETEKQKLEQLDKFQQEGALKAGQYEATKTQIQLNAADARQAEIDKRNKAQREKDTKGDDFMTQILGQNATELQLLDIQQKQKEDKTQEFYDQGLINENEYQQAIAAIQNTYDKKRVNSYSDMLGTTTDNLRSALGEGNKMYKAFAIANAIMNTYQGAVAAFQSAAAIPIIGWVAAPIAAAAAIASGLASVAKIRSAREQGGNLAAGQASTIAERGKAEVIMPAGASRVRTAQQMRQIMGENGGSSGTPNVQIVNQTTGRVDSATTEKIDENNLRVIIRETVSSDMADSNSSISKTRRGTRGQPGF